MLYLLQIITKRPASEGEVDEPPRNGIRRAHKMSSSAKILGTCNRLRRISPCKEAPGAIRRENRTAILPVTLKPCTKVGKHPLMPNIRLLGHGRRHMALSAMSLVLAAAWLCPPAAAQHVPQMELFGGYSYLHFDSKPFGYASDSNLNGWNGSIAVPHLYRKLGVVADVSGNYGSGFREYNFLVGPQLTTEYRGFTVFGRFLYGKARDRVEVNGQALLGLSGLGRAIAGGGGVQKVLSPKLSFRVLQVDYINASTLGQTQNNIRVSTGFVYRFGGK
jgi:hypothetical protein